MLLGWIRLETILSPSMAGFNRESRCPANLLSPLPKTKCNMCHQTQLSTFGGVRVKAVYLTNIYSKSAAAEHTDQQNRAFKLMFRWESQTHAHTHTQIK